MPAYTPVLKEEVPGWFTGAIKLAVNSVMSCESGEGAITKNIAVISGSNCFKRELLRS